MMRKTRHPGRRAAFLLMSALVLAACSYTKPGDMADPNREAALRFQPPPGQSGIYVVRSDTILEMAARFEIVLDGDQLGTLGRGNYLFGVVPPGPHVISSRMIGGLDLHVHMDFTTAEKKNYFFLVSPGWGLSGVSIDRLSEHEGIQRVRSAAGS